MGVALFCGIFICCAATTCSGGASGPLSHGEILEMRQSDYLFNVEALNSAKGLVVRLGPAPAWPYRSCCANSW